MENNFKFRHEFKYMISEGQLAILESRVENLLSPDSHVNENGEYTIRSLYFDDYFNTCFYENENGTDPREKFRVRIYNASPDFISLECKRKERGKTLKTACVINEEECRTLMKGLPIERTQEGTPEVLAKLNLKIRINGLKPVVIVEYDRTPYIYPDGNVRVTFDRNIRSSSDLTHFLQESISTRPVMMKGMQLMEVKWDEFLPDTVKQSLQLEELQATAYSKYYLCRKFSNGGIV